MSFCPQCRAEYEKGIKICPDCEVALVGTLLPEFAEEEDWMVVFTASHDYEAELVRARLSEEGIVARVLSQADHALGLNVGALAIVKVLVHPDDADDARMIIAQNEDIDPDTLDEIGEADDIE
jgi:hypothetical protein